MVKGLNLDPCCVSEPRALLGSSRFPYGSCKYLQIYSTRELLTPLCQIVIFCAKVTGCKTLTSGQKQNVELCVCPVNLGGRTQLCWHFRGTRRKVICVFNSTPPTIQVSEWCPLWRINLHFRRERKHNFDEFCRISQKNCSRNHPKFHNL